jgi:hypothetical protein
MAVKPTDPLSIPGVSQAQLMALRSQGIETYLDLARVNPYDPKFKAYGEEFPRWVNSARALIADTVVRRVEVGEFIVVEAQRLYDRDLTLKAVASRLGVFPQYVEEDVKVSDDLYQITYRRRLDEPLSLGPWLEYKMNARLYGAYLRSSRSASPRPLEKPASLEEVLSWFIPGEVGGDAALAAELTLVTLLSDELHLALIERGFVVSSFLLRALERAVPYLHLHCGGHMRAGELAEVFSSGGVVFVEGLEHCTGEEALVIGEAVRRGRVTLPVKGQSVEYVLPARVIAVAGADAYIPEAPSRVGRLLSKFPLRLHVREPSGEEAYEMLKASRALAGDERLPRYLSAARLVKVRVMPPPPAVEEAARGLLSQAAATAALHPYPVNIVLEAAKARCRARLSDTPTYEDYEYGLKLLQRVLESWRAGQKPVRRRRGVPRQPKDAARLRAGETSKAPQ